MTDRAPTRASERRLQEIRDRAAREGRIDSPGLRPPGAPFPVASPETGYYGLPLLKKPTWTWEVPLYFFTGGAAGAAAVVAAAAKLGGDTDGLARDARWIAAIGSAVSAPLLVSDLGRPERFLAMLRVFKIQSPMSVGAWTLTVFSSASAAAVFADIVKRISGENALVEVIGDAAGAVSAVTGLAMSTYTGVLIGATSIPVWARNVTLLPGHFAASAVASAVSILELLGHDHRALNGLGVAAAAVETAAGALIELETDRVMDPLKKGTSGHLTRAGGVLSGPLPLLLRLVGTKRARRAAAVSALIGSLVTRFAWIEAGRVSSQDTRIPLELP